MYIYDTILNLYNMGQISKDYVLNGVKKGWITAEQASTILGEEDPIETIRKIKLQEISEACNYTIVSGVDIKFNEETVHFNLSIEDQSNINNLFRVVELGGTEFPYQSDGGECRIYTATEIAQIYIASQTLITTQTTYHNALKQYVQSLSSVEDITAVTYGMELPEPYLTSVNEKLSTAKTQMDAIVAKMTQSGLMS